MLSHAPTMFRGLMRSAAMPVWTPVKRSISFTPPRAEAKEGGETGKAKQPVVGKAILAKRLTEAHESLTIKLATEIVDTLLDDIMLTVAEGETVQIPGFGTFKKKNRPARKGRNPSNGDPLDIPEKDYPTFSAGTVFKGVVQTGSWEAYDEMVAATKAAKPAKKK